MLLHRRGITSLLVIHKNITAPALQPPAHARSGPHLQKMLALLSTVAPSSGHPSFQLRVVAPSHPKPSSSSAQSPEFVLQKSVSLAPRCNFMSRLGCDCVPQPVLEQSTSEDGHLGTKGQHCPCPWGCLEPRRGETQGISGMIKVN